MASVVGVTWPQRAVGPTCLEDLKEGAGVNGDSGISPLTVPPWMDFARYHKVQRFFEEHAISLMMAWHCSLVMGFSLPSLLSALVFTQQSGTPAKSLQRYMRTFQHLTAWHLGNVFDPASKAFASLQQVRQLHSGVRSAMDQHMPGTTWISMYDMACVQSGFMGAITILPNKFGIHASNELLEDYVFFWRCVGYQLGVADRFNLCSLGKDVSDNIVWEVIRKVVLQDLAHPPPDYSPIASAYIDGLNLLTLGLPVFSVRSTLAFAYWALGLTWVSLGFVDTCRFYFLRLLLLLVGWLPPWRRFLNRLLLRQARASAQELDTSMAAYQPSCPITGQQLVSQCKVSCPITGHHLASQPATFSSLGQALPTELQQQMMQQEEQPCHVSALGLALVLGTCLLGLLLLLAAALTLGLVLWLLIGILPGSNLLRDFCGLLWEAMRSLG
eukprot:TRINITY_DN102164_c0_g1_i1.p1 TRINITY_DN102164_c0_g1~~TRINITY_DN102164_c0_g1_i1.p1  ORF type:complete len:442 (+),score=74.45 TRINITY_DN102164_c0_g1_i1:147-1472(+)